MDFLVKRLGCCKILLYIALIAFFVYLINKKRVKQAETVLLLFN